MTYSWIPSHSLLTHHPSHFPFTLLTPHFCASPVHCGLLLGRLISAPPLFTAASSSAASLELGRLFRLRLRLPCSPRPPPRPPHLCASPVPRGLLLSRLSRARLPLPPPYASRASSASDLLNIIFGFEIGFRVRIRISNFLVGFGFGYGFLKSVGFGFGFRV